MLQNNNKFQNRNKNSQQITNVSQSFNFTLKFQNESFNTSSNQQYEIRIENQENIFSKQQQSTSDNKQRQLEEQTNNKQTKQQNDPYYEQFMNSRLKMDVRNSYLTKLMNHGYIPQKPRKKYRHLFVFDWDDTFLCTTYLNHFNFGQLKQKDEKLLQKMDQYVCQILIASIKLGDIAIITNAAKGWVEHSSKKFLPKTFLLIQKQKISIISARSQFADQFPNQIKKWKVSAFQKLNSEENNHVKFIFLLKNEKFQLITNIICVGDSTIQMQAGQILASSFEKSLLKTVKFRQNPRIEQLLKQQELLVKKLDEIVNTAKNLTIRLQRKANSK